MRNKNLIFWSVCAVFLMAVSFLRQAGMWKAVALGLLTVACTLAKPNYVIAFVPCLAVVMTWRVARSLAARRREETTKTILHMICLFGPVLIGLVVQFLFTFAGRTDNDDRVIFAPLRAWGQYSPNVPASVVLGIAFPLVTLLLYPRETWADRRTRAARRAQRSPGAVRRVRARQLPRCAG